MNAITLKQSLVEALRDKSGLEQHRPYLGMSSIYYCPRKLYFDFVEGRQSFTDRDHYYCWLGYMYEDRLKQLLGEQVQYRPIEIVAEWDARFRGHADYQFDSALVEIKSTNWDKYQKIVADRRPDPAHVAQVQMYLRHGGWPACFMIYIARDVPPREWQAFPLWIFEIGPDPALADTLDQKARRILMAVDKGLPPNCICNWCRR
jgi:hypothetical protein